MSKSDSKAPDDMSMEDILASIRRMIAQDQDALETGKGVEPLPEDEEVLELTEILPEQIDAADTAAGPRDGAGLSGEPETLSEGADDAPLDLDASFALAEDELPPLSTDSDNAAPVEPDWSVPERPYEPVTVGLTDMMEPLEPAESDMADIPSSLGEPQTAADTAAPVHEADESVAAPSLALPAEHSRDFAPPPEEEVALMDTAPDRLLSPEAAIKTSTAFDQLAQTLVSGYSGEDKTLEGLVRALLKPLMKDWLDANLPRIVEEMIQAEIRRLSR
jgi:cell pole-organizing protein PopZ